MAAEDMPAGLTVPDCVRDLAAGRKIALVWENAVGGLAFLVGDGPDQFIKWAPAGAPLDLPAEAERLAWAGRYIRVARPLGTGRDEAGSWLVTTVLPGRSAVQEPWASDPRTAVTAVGAGLRTLHDALPAADCPFSWSAQSRLASARRRAAAGQIDPADWHEDYQPLG
ncbi:MAG TPA: phosphotransferase, partial [Streptosporangiaceae bacterium]